LIGFGNKISDDLISSSSLRSGRFARICALQVQTPGCWLLRLWRFSCYTELGIDVPDSGLLVCMLRIWRLREFWSKVSSNRPDSSSAGFSGHVENLGPRGHHWTYVFGSDDLEDDYTTYANDAVPLREVLPQGGMVGEGSQSPTPDDIRQGFGEPLRSSSVLEGNPASSSRAVQNKDLDFVEEVNLEWADRWSPCMHSFHQMYLLKPLRADGTDRGRWTINNKAGFLTVFPVVPSLKNSKDSWYLIRVLTTPDHPYRFTAPLQFSQPDPDMSRLPEIAVGPHDRRILKGFASKNPDKVIVPKKWLPHYHCLQVVRVLALGGLGHKFFVVADQPESSAQPSVPRVSYFRPPRRPTSATDRPESSARGSATVLDKGKKKVTEPDLLEDLLDQIPLSNRVPEFRPRRLMELLIPSSPAFEVADELYDDPEDQPSGLVHILLEDSPRKRVMSDSGEIHDPKLPKHGPLSHKTRYLSLHGLLSALAICPWERLSGPSQIRDSDSAQSTNFMAMIELSHRWIKSSFLPADIPIGPVPDPLGITLYHFMKVSKRCFVAVILIFVDLFNLVIIFIHVSI
ncbi:hypothetical protein SOVF_183310, partial [Spinacia oleracea]